METVNDFDTFKKNSERIYINTHERKYAIITSNILFCKADGSYTRVIVEGESSEILVSKTLTKFMKDINEEIFFRCHNSYIINLMKAVSFSSKMRVVSFDGIKIPISKRKANQVYRVLLNIGIKDMTTNVVVKAYNRDKFS